VKKPRDSHRDIETDSENKTPEIPDRYDRNHETVGHERNHGRSIQRDKEKTLNK
jgi:hypothetical protein